MVIRGPLSKGSSWPPQQLLFILFLALYDLLSQEVENQLYVGRERGALILSVN